MAGRPCGNAPLSIWCGPFFSPLLFYLGLLIRSHHGRTMMMMMKTTLNGIVDQFFPVSQLSNHLYVRMTLINASIFTRISGSFLTLLFSHFSCLFFSLFFLSYFVLVNSLYFFPFLLSSLINIYISFLDLCNLLLVHRCAVEKKKAFKNRKKFVMMMIRKKKARNRRDLTGCGRPGKMQAHQ